MRYRNELTLLKTCSVGSTQRFSRFVMGWASVYTQPLPDRVWQRAQSAVRAFSGAEKQQFFRGHHSRHVCWLERELSL